MKKIIAAFIAACLLLTFTSAANDIVLTKQTVTVTDCTASRVVLARFKNGQMTGAAINEVTNGGYSAKFSELGLDTDEADLIRAFLLDGDMRPVDAGQSISMERQAKLTVTEYITAPSTNTAVEIEVIPVTGLSVTAMEVTGIEYDYEPNTENFTKTTGHVRLIYDATENYQGGEGYTIVVTLSNGVQEIFNCRILKASIAASEEGLAISHQSVSDGTVAAPYGALYGSLTCWNRDQDGGLLAYNYEIQPEFQTASGITYRLGQANAYEWVNTTVPKYGTDYGDFEYAIVILPVEAVEPKVNTRATLFSGFPITDLGQKVTVVSEIVKKAS